MKYRNVAASNIGEYVSSKSIPGLREQPRETNCVSHRTISPFSFHFCTKINLYPTRFTSSAV